MQTNLRPAATIEIRPTGAALAAEIGGVDLRTLDDTLFEQIHRAWLEHSVLLFRNQTLEDSDLIAFSRRFGELDIAPVQETGRRFVDGLPEIYVVSNVLGADGEPIGQSGRRRGGLAHRHVLSAAAAENEPALRARSAACGRRDRLHQHVRRL
ncbi:MAG: TauD/TfdA family dioxygenase [Aliidongia sp.]